MKLSFEEVLKYIQPTPEHPNFKDRTGQVHFELYLMFYAGRTKAGDSLYGCRCSCGNYTVVARGNLRPKGVTSCGCVRKIKNSGTSPEDLKFRINKLESETPYTVVDSNHGGVDRKKWTFNCEEHGHFKAYWVDIAVHKKKCAACSKTGGFDQTLPGYFYLNALYDKDNLAGLKYGITNKEVGKRLKQVQSKSSYRVVNICSIYFEKGFDASQLENDFSKVFGYRYISKDAMKDGFTETISPLKIQEALTYLNAFDSSLKYINLEYN